jgi:hypothetical protein
LPSAKPAPDPVGTIVDPRQELRGKMIDGHGPSLASASRSLASLRPAAHEGGKKERVLAVSTVKTFARTSHVIVLSQRRTSQNPARFLP